MNECVINATRQLQLINSDLNSKIDAFDPTAEGAENIPVESIESPLKGKRNTLRFKNSPLSRTHCDY